MSERIYTDDWSIHRSDPTTVVDSRGNTVANCGGMRIGNRHKMTDTDVRSEQEANALRIAAAPDLLAACERAAEALERVEAEHPKFDTGAALGGIHAAIAKARGEA